MVDITRITIDQDAYAIMKIYESIMSARRVIYDFNHFVGREPRKPDP